MGSTVQWRPFLTPLPFSLLLFHKRSSHTRRLDTMLADLETGRGGANSSIQTQQQQQQQFSSYSYSATSSQQFSSSSTTNNQTVFSSQQQQQQQQQHIKGSKHTANAITLFPMKIYCLIESIKGVGTRTKLI